MNVIKFSIQESFHLPLNMSLSVLPSKYLYYRMALQSRKKKKQQELLEEQAKNNQNLRDEITKQVKLSAALQKQYEGKISELQGTALGMCRSIELERKKNEDLKALIENMESKTSVGRRHQSQSLYLPQPTEPQESLESIIKKQHKLQYDFDQLVQKHNESLAQINDIHDQVNASRAERVIYSGVFRNIEREIRLMEQEYRKLIIERVYVEKQKTKAEQLYLKRLAEAQKRVKSRGDILNQTMKEDEKPQIKVEEIVKQAPKLQKVKSNHNAKKLDDSIADTYNTSRIEDSKEQPQSAIAQKLQTIQIDHIKSQTGLGKNLQQIGYYLTNIEQINSKLYQESEKLSSEIYQLDAKLKNVKKSKRIYHVQRLGMLGEAQKIRIQKQQRMKNANQKLDQKIKSERNGIKNLWNQEKLDKLFQILKINPCSDNSICQQNIVLVYKQIEESLYSLPSIQQIPVVTTTCDPDAKEKINTTVHSPILAQMIESADKQRECQKLLLHKQFTEVCEKQLIKSPDKIPLTKPLNKKVRKM